MLAGARAGGPARPPRPAESPISSRGTAQLLQDLVEHGVIDGVVCPLKSGKEAELFVVERAPYHYVAKVYRPRSERSFKNDAGYREGRAVRNTRDARALAKKTAHGQELAEQAWHQAEVDALRKLEAIGARAPRVLMHHDNVIVMEMICDADGQLAPQLARVPLDAAGARAMFEAILQQVVLLLRCDLVHGDLSPYNVLVADGAPVIIDLPQCVSASQNQQASEMLERDVRAIAGFLGLVDPELRALGEQAWQLWVEYERGTLTDDFKLDPARVRPAKVDDLGNLVEFVHRARAEAELEAAAEAGDEDARRMLHARDKRNRRAAAAKAAAAEAREAERRTGAPSAGNGGGAGDEADRGGPAAPREGDRPGRGPRGRRDDRARGDGPGRGAGDRRDGPARDDHGARDRRGGQGGRPAEGRAERPAHDGRGDRRGPEGAGDRPARTERGGQRGGTNGQGGRPGGGAREGDRDRAGRGDRGERDRRDDRPRRDGGRDRHAGDRHASDRHAGERQAREDATRRDASGRFVAQTAREPGASAPATPAFGRREPARDAGRPERDRPAPDRHDRAGAEGISPPGAGRGRRRRRGGGRPPAG